MALAVNTSIRMDDAKTILAARGLQPGGRVQQYMTTQLIGIFDGYVPLRTGVLKGSAPRNNAAPYDTIVYDGPYAARHYYNPGYNFNEAPRRGAYWDKRAWADHKDTFLYNLQLYVDRG
jgi:hypothetical protein